jgi:adenine deaminase
MDKEKHASCFMNWRGTSCTHGGQPWCDAKAGIASPINARSTLHTRTTVLFSRSSPQKLILNRQGAIRSCWIRNGEETMSKARFFFTTLVVLAESFAIFSPIGVGNAKDYNAELSDVRTIANIITKGEPADLLITNINILDVYNEDTYSGSLLINNGKIVAVNPDPKVKARETFDGQGMYAIPGLIDGHFHFDSQLVTPTALSEAMVPQGTTSIVAEFCDIIGAAGKNGVQAAKVLFKDYEKLPYRIYPFAPGKKVDSKIIKEILDWPFIIGLGEMNNTSFVAGNEQDFENVAYAKSLNKMLDGHVEAPTPYIENLYPAVGVIEDHDNWTPYGFQPNYRMGLSTLIASGLNLQFNQIPFIVKNNIPTDNILMATDNIAVETMVRKGDINAVVQQSIEMGIPAIKAIKMGSYNVARHFKMEEQIGSLTPGRYADIVLIKDLKTIHPEYVFKGGELVAKDGKLLKNPTIDYSELVTKSVPGLGNLKAQDLSDPIELSQDKTQAKVKVFNSHGFGNAEFFKEEWLKVDNGSIIPELNGEKLLKFSIIQRYPDENHKRSVVNGYINKFPLDKGAVAVAYSSPTSYIIVLGTNADDMYAAIKEVDKYAGGFAVASGGKIDQSLPMNILGMMTTYSAPELIQRSEALYKSLENLGHANDGRVINTLFALFWTADRHLMLN